jgi:cysteine desulfurase
MKLPVFMDYHSTTPVDPRALESMLPYFCEHFGNPASKSHPVGWKAQEAVDVARKHIAALIGADESEIIFTSGATESNNLAIMGVAQAYSERGNHIITQATEHKGVLDVCKALEKRGFEITVLPVDKVGWVNPQDVKNAIKPNTILCSIMHINNELGTVQSIGEIGAICHAAGVLFHTDAAQSIAKVDFDVEKLQVDLVGLTSHKMYGPKGIGALYVRRKNPQVSLQPIIHGGGHERGLRSGTLNVPAIVGFGETAKYSKTEFPRDAERITMLRKLLEQKLFAGLDDLHINGAADRHPGNLNIAFGGVAGEGLLLALRDICVSSGSACTSAAMKPSYVLKATGLSDALSYSSIRFGLGRYTTEEEVDFVAGYVIEQIKKLRAQNSAK